MPDALLITDASSTAAQAQDLVAAGADPNPYEGMLGTEGASASEAWANKNELLQQCVDIYEEATGTTVIGPGRTHAGPDGKTEELYIAVTDFCSELFMFKAIAEKVGSDLTTENWQSTVDEFGPIDLVADRHRVAVRRASTQRTTRSGSSSSTRRSGRTATGARHRRSDASGGSARAQLSGDDPRHGCRSDAVERRVAALDRAVVGAEVGRRRPAGSSRTSSGAPSTMTSPASRQ